MGFPSWAIDKYILENLLAVLLGFVHGIFWKHEIKALSDDIIGFASERISARDDGLDPAT